MRPFLAKLGALIGIRRPVVGRVLQRIAGQPLAPGSPVAQAIAYAPVPANAMQAAVTAIANNSTVTLTAIKPMSKSMEGWAASFGAALVLINNVAPSLGITISQPVSDAVETITVLFGLPVGSGKAVVAVVTVGAFVFVWVRKKFFTHTITPAAADRAIEQGKAV